MTSKRAQPEALLPAVASGEPDAVDRTIRRYAPLVWSLARSMGFDGPSAEDVVQDVFIDVWESAARYDPNRSEEATFIAMIARRRLIDLRRRLGRRAQPEALEVELAEDAPEVGSSLELSDEARRARAAIGKLEPKQRQLVDLWIVRGLSHSQIAAATGLPLGTVKSGLRRALEQVRALLAGGSPGVVEEASR